MEKNKEAVIENIGSKIILFIITSSALFLLFNKYQYLGIASILSITVLGFFILLFKGRITGCHFQVNKFLLLIYIYFTISYFLSSQNVSNFFSFKFLRFDGNFFFSYMPFFALAIPYFDYKKALSLYFRILFFVFSLFAVIGAFEYITGNYFLTVLEDKHYGAIFEALNNSHNATGSVYAVICIFLLAFFLMEKKRSYKIFYLLGLLICLFGLFMTKSRGSYVGFLVGAVFIIFLYSKSVKRFFIISGSMLVVMAAFIFATGAYKRFINVFNLSDGNMLGRFALWARALDFFKISPIFGIGFARFNDVSPFTVAGEVNGYNGIYAFYTGENYTFSSAHAHNSYLNFLAETGIVGLALILIFWAVCISILWRGYRNSGDITSRTFLVSALGGVITLLALSFTEHYLSAPTVMMCISVTVSLSLGLVWQNKDL